VEAPQRCVLCAKRVFHGKFDDLEFKTSLDDVVQSGYTAPLGSSACALPTTGGILSAFLFFFGVNVQLFRPLEHWINRWTYRYELVDNIDTQWPHIAQSFHMRLITSAVDILPRCDPVDCTIMQ
jgi:hypothetical protein